MWSPRGIKNPGHTVGIRRIRARDVRRTLAKGARIVGRHSQSSRPAMRVAGSAPMCRTSLSPPPPDSASRPIPRMCHEARRGNERGLHGLPGDRDQQNMAQCIASLPMRVGGLGLRSASRMAPAALWASWADVILMTDQRLPRVSRTIVCRLTGGDAQKCLGALVRATEILDRDGFMMRLSWEEFQGGMRPPSPENAAAWLAISRVFHFRVPLSGDRGHCPAMRRRSGPFAFSLRTLHQRCVARSSDRPGIQGCRNTSARWFWKGCVCHCKSWRPIASVVQFWTCGGRHRAACPWSGRLRSRALNALWPECVGRPVPQSGATPSGHECRCSNNRHALDRGVDDRVAVPSRCPTRCGHHIAVRSHICLHACPNAATLNGAMLVNARADKERKYAELVNGDRCRLVVVGVETGGRWTDEAVTFIDHLASARAREAPPIFRGSSFCMWRRRWSRMLACSRMRESFRTVSGFCG